MIQATIAAIIIIITIPLAGVWIASRLLPFDDDTAEEAHKNGI